MGTASAAATTSGNATLSTAAAYPWDVSEAARAAIQSTAKAASAAPTGVGRLVQFRTAVIRNPAMTAAV